MVVVEFTLWFASANSNINWRRRSIRVHSSSQHYHHHQHLWNVYLYLIIISICIITKYFAGWSEKIRDLITSWIVTSACFLARTSCDQVEVEFLALNVNLEVADVALQERDRPDGVHLCSNNILAHVRIPAESPVALCLECLLLLRKTQVVRIREIVSFCKKLIK